MRGQPLVQYLGRIAEHVEVLDTDVVVSVSQVGHVDAGVPAEVVHQDMRREQGIAAIGAVYLRQVLEVGRGAGVGDPHVIADLEAVSHGKHCAVGEDVVSTHPALGNQIAQVDVPGLAAVQIYILPV